MDGSKGSSGLGERHLDLRPGVRRISEASASAAARKIESKRGTLPVVCTPSGGEQSVRIELPRGWAESLSDEELLREIGQAKR